MRGNRASVVVAEGREGSIPAHAGEPFSPVNVTVDSSTVYPRACGGTDVIARCFLLMYKVYPRACGGTAAFLAPRPWPTGLSPRMRGNPVVRGGGRKGGGSIPAHAGEPRFRETGVL